jgi:hypothetical protein
MRKVKMIYRTTRVRLCDPRIAGVRTHEVDGTRRRRRFPRQLILRLEVMLIIPKRIRQRRGIRTRQVIDSAIDARQRLVEDR